MATGKPCGVAPIGMVVMYLSSLTNIPGLPGEWVQCNGQTLSDSESVYNGKVIPNLNAGGGSGESLFLRGGTTSGSTGGAETHTHTYTVLVMATAALKYMYQLENANSSPSYFADIWIMRIK